MDESVKRLVALLLTCCVWAAQAQTMGMPDPTRPPAAVLPQPAAGQGAPAPASSGPVLQAVKVVYAAPARNTAVIDGQVVGIGGKVGDAVVLSIASNRVVLGAGGKKQVLELYPEAESRTKHSH
jgi:MSHA biogenesis protein MshK